MSTLHVGKRTEEVKTMVPEVMHEFLADLSRTARCTPSDLILDAVYLAYTGKTYAEHVANDRRSVMIKQGRPVGDTGANE